LRWKRKKRVGLRIALIISIAIFYFFGTLYARDKCIQCHTSENAGKKVNLKELSASVHKNLSCTDCHGEIIYPHRDVKKVECSRCHSNEEKNYKKSTHAKAYLSGSNEAPVCFTCHGEHNVQKIQRTRIPDLCLNCHSDRKMEEKYKLPGVEFIQSYKNSVHGHALFSLGLVNAPVCSTCHNSHLVLPPEDPDSNINRMNIPELCGRCHISEKKEYFEGIHGLAIKKNIKEAPVCTDCHGEHTISIVTDPNSSVSAKNLPNTCSRCHDNVALAEKFGFKSKRFTTYLNTFHGVANIYGATTVANCASCHGNHQILPSTDPRSSTHPDNIPKTCGKCHPGAGINFAKGPIHVEAVPEVSRPAYYVRTFYKWFIGILCVMFVIHIVVDYAGYRRKKKSFEKEIKIDEDERP